MFNLYLTVPESIGLGVDAGVNDCLMIKSFVSSQKHHNDDHNTLILTSTFTLQHPQHPIVTFNPQ